MNSERLVQKLNKRKIKVQSSFFNFIQRAAFYIITRKHKAEFHYNFDKEKMKGRQVILLADHSSFDNFYFAIYGYPFVKLNTVMGYAHFFERALFYIYVLGGAIPKKQFETDLRAVRQMSKVISMGGSLCLFPEGTYSFAGSNQPINPSTMNFIKQLGVDVVLCKSYGAYLSRPVYRKSSCKGHREYHYDILFTKEELKQMDENAIYEKMLSCFAYNDFKWEKEKQYSYNFKKGIATGMEEVLFYCPKCKKEFTLKTNKDEIYCDCGNRIKVDNHYKNIPLENSVCDYDNLNEWYIAQRKMVKQEITNPDFSISYECNMIDIRTDHLRINPYYVCGEGNIKIDASGIRYIGTSYGENVDLFFDIKKIPCFKQDDNYYNFLYYHGKLYCFEPKEKNRTIKYMMVVEELHNLVDPIWAKAYNDAYYS